MTPTPLPPTPRCDAEVYESGPTAANYGISDPDVVVDYTFAQQLERELVAATQARADLEAENKRLREALQAIVKSWDNNTFCRERFVKSELGDYWAPTSAMVNSETIAAARAALEKQP